MYSNDTIAAIATPPGKGGIGIVRVSGPLAASTATLILGSLPAERVATFSKFFDEKNIIPLSGTREGLFSIAMTLNTKKICLPNPFYQVYLGPSLLDNIQKSFLISNEENNFLFDLKKLKLLLHIKRKKYFCIRSSAFN